MNKDVYDKDINQACGSDATSLHRVKYLNSGYHSKFRSGCPGITYDPKRMIYIATMVFQKSTFETIHLTYAEALESMREMKRIRQEYLEWWSGLAGKVHTENHSNYQRKWEMN